MPCPAPPLLMDSQDPAPYRVENPTGAAPLLLVCDHASNYIPPRLQGLGLSRDQLREHIAWDLGAADLCLQLAMRLDCQAVLGNYSRLLVDLNRDPEADDPSLFPETSDGYPVPGNRNLSPAERDQRIRQLHAPYHQEVEARLRELAQLVDAPALLSVHTFTPQLQGSTRLRPWHAGVLWNRDPRLAQALIRHLGQETGLVVGDNEPYSGQEIAHTVNRHAEAHGFPGCAIEIRQDLLQNYHDCQCWADRLVTALDHLLADAELHRVRFYGKARPD